MFSFLDIIYNTVAQVSHTDVWNGRTKLFVVVASGLKVNLDGKCLGTGYRKMINFSAKMS